ncbi:MAG: ATP-binding protein [Nitriliruptoraceae bacterium]
MTTDPVLKGQQRLINALTDAALLVDRDGTVVAANTRAQTLLHMSALPATLAELSDDNIRPLLDDAFDSGTTTQRDLNVNGSSLTVIASRVDTHVLIVITDHTRERRVEELRRDFVVNASHELKTPVTSIQTLAEALAVVIRTKPSRVPQLIARLSAEAERLSALVTDLLDLRRLEERGEIGREPVNLAALIRNVVASEVQRADARNVTVAVDGPDTMIVDGVTADLEVIVKNLVVNAVKYNRDGGDVTVTLHSDGARVRLDVTDTGIGIPEDDLPRIFERFYRVDTARSRETGGTGLGLSIVRHAVELHDGQVTVTSRRGEGSTFTVVLPAHT